MPRKSHSCFIMLTLVVVLLALPPSNMAAPGVPDDASQSPPRIYGEDISRSIFQAVSYARYLGFIQKLTENGSRSTSSGSPPSFSSANVHARNWITNQLETLSNGRIEVEVLGDHKSVVGRLRGYLPEGAPVLMVGGHYDSVSGAPGANDDGTGVAAALELANVMSRYEWPLDIYFCAWNSEEIGLLGSAEVAQIFKSRGIDILTYWNVDMLLVQDESAPADERVLMVHNDQSMKFAQVSKAMSKNFGRNLIRPLPKDQFSAWSRSDHASFLSEGYEKVLFAFESGFSDDPAYHTSDDTWDNPLYNYTVARDAVASIGASMAYTMSRAHNQQHILKFYGSVRPFSFESYYIPITTETRLTINSSWSGEGIQVTLQSSQGDELFSFTNDEAHSTGETIANISLGTLGLYELTIAGNASADASFTMHIGYEDDLDNDGIEDSEQFWLDSNLFNEDQDEDGLSDAMEIIIGTLLDNADSDGDAMPDYWEYTHGLDPMVPNGLLDSDGDGLRNIDEYGNATEPQNPDSDADLLPDGWEVVNGTDPLHNDAQEDPDQDGVLNIYEYGNGTLPHLSDTDGDSLPDLWEIITDLNPRIADAHLDYDSDGLSNIEEYAIGTNPQNADSDFDGMPDSFEVYYSLDPLTDDADADPDGDGMSNIQEYMNGGDPRFPFITLPLFMLVLAILFAIVIVYYGKNRLSL